MRIIDKNKDFYDYLQNIYRDDSLVFDRRGSYDLQKNEFARYFRYQENHWAGEYDKNKLILLQVCNSFWLFNLEVTRVDGVDICADYNLTLIDSWRDYSAKRKLIELSHIATHRRNKTVQQRVAAVRAKTYTTIRVFNDFSYNTWKNGNLIQDRRTIPILKNIGIAALVNPLDIYLALEEYFGLEVQESERCESVGLTNKEKIWNHGFDTKKSFRNMK